jgi:hypothetical protein
LEKSHEGGRRLYQQQWPPLLGTEEAELERNLRGGERSDRSGGLLRCVLVEKGIEKKRWGLPFALSGRERNHEAVGERRRANGLSGTNYSFALLHYLPRSLLFVRRRQVVSRMNQHTRYPYTSTTLQVRFLYQE